MPEVLFAERTDYPHLTGLKGLQRFAHLTALKWQATTTPSDLSEELSARKNPIRIEMMTHSAPRHGSYSYRSSDWYRIGIEQQSSDIRSTMQLAFESGNLPRLEMTYRVPSQATYSHYPSNSDWYRIGAEPLLVYQSNEAPSQGVFNVPEETDLPELYYLAKQFIAKTSRLYSFGTTRDWVFERRNLVLNALDAFEEGEEDPKLMAELEHLNEQIDVFRKEDYESAQQNLDPHLIHLLNETNEELLNVFTKIMDRLKVLDGEDNQAG